MLEALEIGTDGVVLRTESWEEVAALAAYMRGREAERIPLCKGTVTRVEVRARVKGLGVGAKVQAKIRAGGQAGRALYQNPNPKVPARAASGHG